MAVKRLKASAFRWIVFLMLSSAILSYTFREPITQKLIEWRLDPGKPFTKFIPPRPPDYTDLDSWAALPQKQDYSDVAMPGKSLQKGIRKADVFFIHPTTYMSSDGWNGPIDDKKSLMRVNSAVMKHMASVFSDCCNVYAPKYRQATLWFGRKFEPDGRQAIELAYKDVVRAFKHFLKKWNQKRPLILAGHSQGAIHALRLLEEYIANTPLKNRLISAYIVGNPVHKDKFKRGLRTLHPCAHSTDTGCVISWMTLGAEGDIRKYSSFPKYYRPKGYENVKKREHMCTNPISWKAEGAAVSYAKHLGAIRYKRGLGALSKPLQQTVRGGCKNGAMIIEKPRLSKGFNYFLLGKDDYHIYDFNLFYMNIRTNANQRVQAYLNKQTSPPQQRVHAARTRPTSRPTSLPNKK